MKLKTEDIKGGILRITIELTKEERATMLATLEGVLKDAIRDLVMPPMIPLFPVKTVKEPEKK